MLLKGTFQVVEGFFFLVMSSIKKELVDSFIH